MARRSPTKKLGAPAPPRAKAPPPVRSDGTTPGLDRRRLLLVGGIAAVVIAAVVLAFVFTRKSSSAAAPAAAIPWAQLGTLQTGPPPWNNGVAALTDRLKPLGLTALGSEGTVLHIHQHLDLYVAGKHVKVPALIGIYDNSYITEVHVHDGSGVIHIESPTQRTFTLGQFFGEWGVKLTAKCVANYCGHLKWWVNGQQVTGDPAALKLRAHQEIVIAEGPPPLIVPKSYKFPQGE